MLKAAFIGINKHADPTIRELTGAARDATALWALIQDTLPDCKASLIINADATTSGAALHATLKDATPDDTVVVAFSGHGTNSHHFVTHDTARKDIDATTDLAPGDNGRVVPGRSV